MAVKILIQRKIKPGKENELAEAIRKIRSEAMHARGFISGETLRSAEDPSIHMVISAWKSLEDWQNWVNTPERKAFEKEMDAILAEPAKISPYHMVTYFDLREVVDNVMDETIGNQ
ncbi:MAG: antibiotic biosynthesis monooxygenase [Deltaproteobacteria bacterium]|nr:antibiotic biosynthesis monooxygenase [Deltaproteobacteria bacterium]